MGHVVVVGAGQAGSALVAKLRALGHQDRITLIGEEPSLPYQRPPLSKAYLLGKLDDDGVLLKGAALYDEAAIRRIDTVAVTAIDRTARTARLSDGSALDYGRLILATGARQRTLGVPGEDLDGVLTLRTLPTPAP